MIWALLAALNDPENTAVTYRNGEFYIAPLAEVEASGARIIKS